MNSTVIRSTDKPYRVYIGCTDASSRRFVRAIRYLRLIRSVEECYVCKNDLGVDGDESK